MWAIEEGASKWIKINQAQLKGKLQTIAEFEISSVGQKETLWVFWLG